MARYRVKALLEVGYDAEYTGKMTSALEETEDLIIVALSKMDFMRSCEFKKSKNSVGRLLKKEEKLNGYGIETYAGNRETCC